MWTHSGSKYSLAKTTPLWSGHNLPDLEQPPSSRLRRQCCVSSFVFSAFIWLTLLYSFHFHSFICVFKVSNFRPADHGVLRFLIQASSSPGWRGFRPLREPRCRLELSGAVARRPPLPPTLPRQGDSRAVLSSPLPASSPWPSGSSSRGRVRGAERTFSPPGAVRGGGRAQSASLSTVPHAAPRTVLPARLGSGAVCLASARRDPHALPPPRRLSVKLLLRLSFPDTFRHSGDFHRARGTAVPSTQRLPDCSRRF